MHRRLEPFLSKCPDTARDPGAGKGMHMQSSKSTMSRRNFVGAAGGAVALGLAVEIAGAVFITRYYFSRVAYICPECHEVFRPKFREAFWANHTPHTRRLTCPHCGHKGFCVETWAGKRA